MFIVISAVSAQAQTSPSLPLGRATIAKARHGSKLESKELLKCRHSAVRRSRFRATMWTAET
jgi:hypothetical protein